MAGFQPVTPNAVGRQPGHRRLQILRRVPTARCWRRCRRPPTDCGNSSVRLSTRSAAANTATIRPPAGRLPNRRPRSASSSAPSSRPNTPGDAGRRILADAVAEHHVRFEAPRLPEAGQPHLDREQRGLGVAGLPQGVACRRVASKMTSSKGLSSTSATAVRAPGHGLGEHRLGLEQLAGHAGELAALPREQPRCLRRVSAIAPHQTGCRPVVGERTEQLARGCASNSPPTRRGARSGIAPPRR